MTAFSAHPCKILCGLVNLKKSAEKLHYLKQTQQTPLGLLNLPCIQWPHRCCPGSGGQWLPVSCLAQTIHLQNRQLVPKGDSCLTRAARVWDSPVLAPSTASTNRIRNSSLGSTWDGKAKILKETQKASQTSTMFVSTNSCHSSGQSDSQAQLLFHNKASLLLISVLTITAQFFAGTRLSHAIFFPLQLKVPLLALQLSPSICHCPLILPAF